jgi:predicted amidohydrolase YtcJ
MKTFIPLLFSSVLLATACTSVPETSELENVDVILTNGKVYTIDSAFTVAEAIAVKNNIIVSTGSSADIQAKFSSDSVFDLAGKSVYPGFYDAHGHYYRYGLSLQSANLVGTTSWQDVLNRLQIHRTNYPQQAWLTGRGWDQNDWERKDFPTNKELNQLYPDVPVILTRIDGHAALANKLALEKAGITASTQIAGGKIVLVDGQPSGLLIDNAVDLVSEVIPEASRNQQIQGLKTAQDNLLAVGLTSVADAGLEHATIALIDSLQQTGDLKLRVYAMLNPTTENMARYFEYGPLLKDRLTVRSFKVYSDGALGSRGALLLQPYTDDPHNVGLLLTEAQKMEDLAAKFNANGFQMNTHCIGDSANRLVLDIYANELKGKNDKRWRIEHAQVVTIGDQNKFSRFSIIPSVQPTHATSDMYWAGERLGEREPTAYAYQDLLQQAGLVALGSDFPIEDINPLYGFYAATARQDAEKYPSGGYQPENKLTREQALRGMTIWAAYANFEDKDRGSLEAGKLADLVILDTDLMTAEPLATRNAQVLYTIIDGEIVYQK